MTLPTTCMKCGFGEDHLCERSVCPCRCHEDEMVPKAGKLPPAEPMIQASPVVLDEHADVFGYAMAD